jgi:hypothetical protein
VLHLYGGRAGAEGSQKDIPHGVPVRGTTMVEDLEMENMRRRTRRALVGSTAHVEKSRDRPWRGLWGKKPLSLASFSVPSRRRNLELSPLGSCPNSPPPMGLFRPWLAGERSARPPHVLEALNNPTQFPSTGSMSPRNRKETTIR